MRVTERPLPNIHPNRADENEQAVAENADADLENEREMNIENEAMDEEMIHMPSPNCIDDDNEHDAVIKNDAMDEDMIDLPITNDIDDIDCVDPLNLKHEVQPIDIINGDDAEDALPELLEGQYEVIDDEVMMFYDDLSAFKPQIIPQMEIKRNDAFSGTLPYKEYVSKFQCLLD